MLRYAALLGTLLGAFTSAGGALLSVSEVRFGAGAETVGADSQLVWLDLSITSGKSYDEISRQLGPGGLYVGYRFATPNEFEGLFRHADIQDIDDYTTLNRGTARNVDPARALIALMGPSNLFQIAGITLSELSGFTSEHVRMNGF